MKIATFSALIAGLTISTIAFAAHQDISMTTQQVCRDIRAELHELKTNDNCNSPLAFCSAGTIDGNFGLDGTTFFSVDGSAATPPEAPGTSSYTGMYTINTRHGTLTLRETGISYPRRGNPEGGVLVSIAEVLSGTGRYSTTTGILFFYGHNGRGLPSDIDVSGTLCTNWSH
jgi:hypothetical protein